MNDTIKLPVISHLQFIVLSAFTNPFLMEDWLESGQVRALLHNLYGIESDGPKFYQFMGRLERSGYLTGSYAQKDFIEGGKTVQRRIRVYELSKHGSEVFHACAEFYRNVLKKCDRRK